MTSHTTRTNNDNSPVESDNSKRLSRRRFLAYSTMTMLAAACSSDSKTTSNDGTAAPGTTAGGSDATTAPSGSSAAGTTTPATSAPGSGEVFKFGKAGDITDFNPWDISDTENEVYNQVFSRLVWRDLEGNEHLDLAESYEIAADGKSVTVKVRTGVKWHDGADFSAEDYVTMYGYLSDPALAEDPNIVEMTGVLTLITSVEAPDPTTLVITSSEPIPYVVDLLDYWHAIRIDNPTDYGFVATPPVGTGPFKLTEVNPGQRITFTANPDYYVEGQPALGGFEVSLFGAATNLMQNLTAGSVDGLLIANPAELEAISGDDAFRFEVTSSGPVTNLYVNVTKAPFDNPEVRQALSYSMNRVGMVEAASFGRERPVSSPFYSPSSLAYSEELVLSQAFDLEKASSLLDGAGVSGLRIVYPAPTPFAEAEIYGLIWQQDLAQIGVELVIEAVDQGRWSDIGSAKVRDETDVVFWFNGRANRDPAIFWNTQKNYGGTAETIWGYLNDELIGIVAEAAAEVDVDKRKALYVQTNQILADSSHILHISTRSSVRAYSSSVTNVKSDLIGAFVLTEANVSR